MRPGPGGSFSGEHQAKVWKKEGQGSIRAFLHSKKLDCGFITLVSRGTFVIQDGLVRLGVRVRSVIFLKAHDVKSGVEVT